MGKQTIILLAMLALVPGGLLSGNPEPTVKQQFKVVHDNRTIGLLSTSLIRSGTRTTYLLHSTATLNLIFKLTVTERISDAFEQGILVKSVQQRTVNGRVKSHHTLDRVEGHYRLVNTEQQETTCPESITASVVELYYREPVQGERIYSEGFQQLIPIRQLEQGVYCLELPNGNVSTYYYENGVLQKVESRTAWGTILFIRG